MLVFWSVRYPSCRQPLKDLEEIAKKYKGDPKLAAIPVVVLTASSLDEDILSSYDHHANCYISKPVDLDGLLKVVGLIEDFWLTVVKLPEQADPELERKAP